MSRSVTSAVELQERQPGHMPVSVNIYRMTQIRKPAVPIQSAVQNQRRQLRVQSTVTEYRAAQSGALQNLRFRQVQLDSYIQHCSSLQRLAAAVAYGLSTDPERRDTPDYRLVVGSMNWGGAAWRDWIVYRTAPGEDLSLLILINIAGCLEMGLPDSFLERLAVELRILAQTG